MSWRELEITQKQADCIADMQEFSPYPIPKFEGKTRGEAADYIDRYGKMAHEDPFGFGGKYE